MNAKKDAYFRKMTELNKYSTDTQYKEDEQFNRLLSLFHIGTEVKRKLLDWYLSEKELDLLDWLTSLGNYFLQFEDVKRALRKSESIELTDLVLNTIDIVLKNNCFDMFWDCCLLNTSFEDILNSHKDMLYRRYEHPDNQNENQTVTKDQLDLLFKRVENSVKDEVGNGKCISASEEKTEAHLESKLSFLILSIACPLFKSVNAVSECQRQISKIAVLKSEVVDLKFADLWDKMEAHIDNISSHCKLYDYFKREYTKIKKAKCNKTLVQQNRKSILEEALNNQDFVADKIFCNLVRNELELLTYEENLNLARILIGGTTFVQLTEGQYRKGAFSLGVIGNTEDDLEKLYSLSSSPDVAAYEEEVDENVQTDDKQERLHKYNHLKLVQLITDIARDAFAEVLKERIPGDYGVVLLGMKNKLSRLLDNHERRILYPDNSYYTGDLSDLDISLSYIILRNLNTICPHKRNWGNKPDDDDRCLSANIDRIRIFKNRFVSHSPKHLSTVEEFLEIWKDIRKCIIEIVTTLTLPTACTTYKNRIDYLLSSDINPVTEMELCNTYERVQKGERRIEKKINYLIGIINDIRQRLNTTNRQPIDAPEVASENTEYQSNLQTTVPTMASQATDTLSSGTDTTVLYTRPASQADVSHQSSFESASTATEDITNRANKTNLPSGNNMHLGNVPLELRIDGTNIPSVEEIEEMLQTLTTNEVHPKFVTDGSIIIGLDISPSAFHDVGHFIVLVDTLLLNLLERHIQNNDDRSYYIIVSLDFLDKNNEPLTIFKPSFMEDKDNWLGKDEAMLKINSNTEKLNYVKLFLSVNEYGTNAQIEFIKYQLKRLNLTFHELLDEKAHELYHLCYTQRCCQCGPIDELPHTSSIRPDQYFFLFHQETTPRLNGHDQMNRHSKCCNYAKSSVSVDDLDFALANTILVHCCQELLWHCCLGARNKTLQELLEENKHVIFHMWISHKSCHPCSIGETLKAKGTIDDTQWCRLFKHITVDNYPSSYSVNQDITTRTLGSKLSYTLLQEFSEEIQTSKQLALFLNIITHHATLKIESEEFEKMWLTIETILLHLAYIYGEDIIVRDKLHILKSTGGSKEDSDLLLAKKKAEQDFEEELNEIYLDVSYMKEYLFKAEDFNEQIEHKMTEIKHMYLQRFSNKIQNNPEQRTSDVQKFFERSIFTTSETVDSHEESITICVRLKVTNIPDEASEQDAIYKADSDIEDSFTCGKCEKTYTSMDTFIEHTKAHMTRIN